MGFGMHSRHARSTAVAPRALPPLPIDEGGWSRAVLVLALPPQEAKVLGFLLRGMRDKQIAEHAGIGVPTVRLYLSRTFRRAGVSDRVELILRVVAIANGRHDG